MSILLDGTLGITTPGLTNTGTETLVNLTTTGNTILGDASTDTLNVGNGGLVKDASGNVGIGTASPATKLHVKGPTNYDGVITADNSTTTGGGIFSVRQNGTVCGYYTTNGTAQGNTGSDIAIYAETGKAVTFFSGGSATERMRIDSSGNVGIGSSQLNAAFLTVSKSVNGDVGLSVLNTNTGASANARIDIGNANYGNSELTITAYSDTFVGTLFGVTAAKLKAVFDNSNTATTNGLLIGTAGANPLYFVTNASERMRLDTNGYLLVGYTTSNGAYRLQVNSQIFATSATIATSDGRYKKDIQPLDGALGLVNQLNPVQFSWKKHPVHDFDTSTPTIGFIAQEVQQILADKPYLNSIIKSNECVIEPEEKDSDGNVTKQAVTEKFLGIAEGNMIALLTKAIQEQQALIQQLQADVAALKGSTPA